MYNLDPKTLIKYIMLVEKRPKIAKLVQIKSKT